jgi:hypothetical protein
LLDDKVADAGTGQRAKEASQAGAASAHCNQDPSQRQRLSAGSSTPFPAEGAGPAGVSSQGHRRCRAQAASSRV